MVLGRRDSCCWFGAWRFNGEELLREAAAITFQQGLNALWVWRAQHESGMVALFDADSDLRILVGRGVRFFLARQAKNYGCVFPAHIRQLVGLLASGNLNSRPLPPQVDAGRGFHHFI